MKEQTTSIHEQHFVLGYVCRCGKEFTSAKEINEHIRAEYFKDDKVKDIEQ
jgi:hypothetical protein